MYSEKTLGERKNATLMVFHRSRKESSKECKICWDVCDGATVYMSLLKHMFKVSPHS